MGSIAIKRGSLVGATLCALMLWPAAQASAATWANEAAMIDATSRSTFVLDPGRGNSWTREELLSDASHRAFYKRRGFANVLMWAPEFRFAPSGATRWAGCGDSIAPDATPGGECPPGRDQPAHFSAMSNALADTSINALVWEDAFIALACGNFSERTIAEPMPVVSGVKYEDINGDGSRNAGEPGLAGWTIELYQGGVYAASTITDDAGRYRFLHDANDLPNVSEDFEVREVQRAGWAASRTPAPFHVPHGAGSAQFPGGLLGDFGNYRPATIRGIKYEDMDADGARDADDPGLAGWTIDVQGPPFGPWPPATGVTGPTGAYSVTGLRPGTFTVAERMQPGWRNSAPVTGVRTITVRSGETADADFGNYRPATIRGVKFDDHDVNRLRAAGEPGLAGWSIALSGGRSPDAGTTTDASGGYAFEGLIPGTYVIAETLRGGWRQSAPASGTHTVRVRSGDVAGADFGNVCLGSSVASISEETTGAPLSGVEVRIEEISVPGVLANEPALPRTTTGTPTFGDLLPGDYRVVVFLPALTYTTDPRLTVVDGRLAVVAHVTVLECAASDVRVKLFTTSTGKVTGGAKMLVPNGFGTAGFVFMTRQEVPQGSLEYVDHATGLNLHSERIEQIHVARNEAWIGGVVAIDGRDHRFELHLVDNGEPGRDDRFELIVENGYRAGYGETIEGGNVQIHAPKKT